MAGSKKNHKRKNIHRRTSNYAIHIYWRTHAFEIWDWIDTSYGWKKIVVQYTFKTFITHLISQGWCFIFLFLVLLFTTVCSAIEGDEIENRFNFHRIELCKRLCVCLCVYLFVEYVFLCQATTDIYHKYFNFVVCKALSEWQKLSCFIACIFCKMYCTCHFLLIGECFGVSFFFVFFCE